ncbi:MAG: hypothetical protein AB4057_13945 [Crocosphaera sp.]
MTIHRNPEKLDIYYCDTCGAILITTDIEKSNQYDKHDCPSCFADTFIRLPKEDPHRDSYLSDVDEPEKLYLKRFFQLTDNVYDFLSAFQQIYKCVWLDLKLDRVWGFNLIEVLIEISSEVTLKVQLTDGTTLKITKEVNALLNKLNISI